MRCPRIFEGDAVSLGTVGPWVDVCVYRGGIPGVDFAFGVAERKAAM